MTQSGGSSDSVRTVKSVETACEIIDLLDDVGEARLTDVADAIDLTKATTYTHLVTLQNHGLVKREDNLYCLSFKFLELGEGVRKRKRVVEIAKTELDEIAETEDVRTHLLFEDHGRGVLAYVTTGPTALSTSEYLGRRWDLHCNAAGKAILAYLPTNRVKEIIDQHGLERYTPTTTVDREELFDELQEIREMGVAYNYEEQINGLHAVGTPVLQSDGGVFGAISVGIPTNEQSESRRSELTEVVKNTANRIEVNFQTP